MLISTLKYIFIFAFIIWLYTLSSSITELISTSLFHVPLPPLEEPWWGPGNESSDEDTSVRPFAINVSQTVLDDLRWRLNNAPPSQPPLEGVQQQYGINTNLLNNITNFWLNSYDWKAREKLLNQFPQYTTRLQGLTVHYLHVKPKIAKTRDVKVLPLLVLHGWPSSTREFFDIIPLLTRSKKRGFVFEVIAPSLPGYTFSDAAVRPGLNPKEIAIIFKNLMQRLGFDRYYIHGGDWGSQVVVMIATLYPDKVIGMHSNFCFVDSPLARVRLFLGSFIPRFTVSADIRNKVYPLSERYMMWVKESGYMHIQATKPDTVGVALRDSPVGLAAYLLEKFTIFTNLDWMNLEDGGLTRKFKLEDLLDNVMLYWITGSITTSMRLYAESFSMDYMYSELLRLPIVVPAGCARFSHEVVYQPEFVLKDKFVNLVHVADYEGGHFAALEEPKVLASDIFLFVEKAEKSR